MNVREGNARPTKAAPWRFEEGDPVFLGGGFQCEATVVGGPWRDPSHGAEVYAVRRGEGEPLAFAHVDIVLQDSVVITSAGRGLDGWVEMLAYAADPRHERYQVQQLDPVGAWVDSSLTGVGFFRAGVVAGVEYRIVVQAGAR